MNVQDSQTRASGATHSADAKTAEEGIAIQQEGCDQLRVERLPGDVHIGAVDPFRFGAKWESGAIAAGKNIQWQSGHRVGNHGHSGINRIDLKHSLLVNVGPRQVAKRERITRLKKVLE
jgi:hypothetical protein